MQNKHLILICICVAIGAGLLLVITASQADNEEQAQRATRSETPSTQQSTRVVTPTGIAHLDGLLNPQGATITADLRSKLPRLSEPAHIALVTDLLKDQYAGDTARNEAMVLLRNSQQDLAPLLMELLERDNEAERIRAFFTQHLGVSLLEQPQQETLRAYLRNCMQSDRHRGVRREAFAALLAVEDPATAAKAADLLHLPAGEGLRDLAIHECYRQNTQNCIPRIREFLSADADGGDVITRIAALNVLGKWQDHESEASIREALQSSSKSVQRAAAQALSRLHVSEGP